MNLTDVEKAVVELSSRHSGLTKEFLRTLLEASGWEEKNIKEAEVILSARLAIPAQDGMKVNSRVPHTPSDITAKADITFFHSDGTEEGELVIPEAMEVPKRETASKKDVVHLPTDTPSEKTDVSQIVVVEKEDVPMFPEDRFLKDEMPHIEEESLITANDKPKLTIKSLEIPDNLPLVPFESSPHIWSFGRYKDTFHPDQMNTSVVYQGTEPRVEEKKIEEKHLESHYVAVPVITKEQEAPRSEPHTHEAEIDFEKTPITKGDESLVVLAAVMLLAIMLILGYMYSNGRL